MGRKRIVSKRVIEGYWSCPYCSTKNIRGLEDCCPSCGVRKPDNTKYYLDKENITEVTKEVAKSYIKTLDSLSNNADWVCDYCNCLNNFEDNSCRSCGSSKSSSDKDYFNRDKEHVSNSQSKQDLRSVEYSTNNESAGSSQSQQDLRDSEYSPYNKEFIKFALSVLATIFGIGLLVFLLFPIKYIKTVNSFSWGRTIRIEELKTFKESDWRVPIGGRVYDEREEFYEKETVVSHYETVEVEKSRQVLDHYDYNYETIYEDNGNGTFDEYVIEEEVPVYRTEYYTEYEQVPIYKTVDVYKTKYYYEIDKWVIVSDSDSFGYNQKPYWNTNYYLSDKQRDITRFENYVVHYDDDSSRNIPYKEWIETKIGDKLIETRCRLGIVYKRESNL